jgi:hypothetical protein
MTIRTKNSKNVPVVDHHLVVVAPDEPAIRKRLHVIDLADVAVVLDHLRQTSPRQKKPAPKKNSAAVVLDAGKWLRNSKAFPAGKRPLAIWQFVLPVPITQNANNAGADSAAAVRHADLGVTDS